MTGMRCHEDDGGRVGQLGQSRCQLQPVVAGHVNVQQHQLHRGRLCGLQHLQGLVGIGGFLDMVRAMCAVAEQSA